MIESREALALTWVSSKLSSLPQTSPASWYCSTTVLKKRRKTARPYRVRVLARLE